MAQTLEQHNIIRQRMGQEPLTELPNAVKPPEDAPEKSVVEDKKETAPINQPAAQVVELTDEAVLEYLKNKKGLSLQTFEDLNKPVTEADIQAQLEKKEDDKLAFGLNKGLFNRKTYENFISDRKSAGDFVFANFYETQKADDPSLTDEEIQTEFAVKFGLDAEPGTRKHKRGQQEINVLANELLKAKYPKIISLDSDYAQFETAQTTQKTYQQKIIQATPTYKKDLDEVFVQLGKIQAKFSDDKEYAVPVLETSLQEIKTFLSQPEFIEQRIQGGYTKEELHEIVYTALLRKNFPLFVEEITKQAMLEHQKGVRGILPSGKQVTEVAPTNNLTEKQAEALKRIFPTEPVVAN